MEQHEKIFRRRLYTVAAFGGCVLLAAAWLFIKGALTPRGFAVVGLIYWAAMFAALYLAFRSFRRPVQEFRAEQIVKGISADSLDREQCIKTIRTMKRLIALFALFLVYGFFATRGRPPLSRVEDASFNIFMISIFLYSLLRSQKKLKSFSEESKSSAME